MYQRKLFENTNNNNNNFKCMDYYLLYLLQTKKIADFSDKKDKKLLKNNFYKILLLSIQESKHLMISINDIIELYLNEFKDEEV